MKFSENPFYVLKVTDKHNFKLKITKGHNSLIILSRVMVLTLCTFSDHALYFYQVSQKDLLTILEL